jgi:hypothetical protein
MSRASHRPIHAQTSTHSRAEQSPAPAHHGGTMGPGILLISKLLRPPQRALAPLGLLRSLLFHPALRRSGGEVVLLSSCVRDRRIYIHSQSTIQ